MNIEILKKAGIDYDSGLDRFMGDTELYGTVLNLFLADHTMDDAVSAREREDFRAMFETMHELKGIAGNEDMTELYRAICPLVELLREAPYDASAIDGAFGQVRELYRTAKQGIADAREG